MDRRTIFQSWAALGVTAVLPRITNAVSGDTASKSIGTKDIATGARLPVPAQGRIPVAFLLSTDARVVDFAGPWGVFECVNAPNMDGSPFQLYTVAESTAPLKVSGGMQIVPDYTLAHAPQPKVIVVPAQAEPTEAMLAWLRRVSRDTDLTMSVCDGSYVLAKAGLLNGKAATAHHGALTRLAADFPDISFKRGARFVDAGNISTSGGLTCGIDLALHVVERYYGREVAEKTATMLEYQGLGWKDPNSNVAFLKSPVSTDEHPICPVCDMEVDKNSSPTEVYRGRKYYFCSGADKRRFDQSPEKFVSR